MPSSINKKEEVSEKEEVKDNVVESYAPKVQGLKILGKIDLNAKKSTLYKRKKQ